MNEFHTAEIGRVIALGTDEVKNPELPGVIYSLGRDAQNEEEYRYAFDLLLSLYRSGTPRVQALCVQAFSMMAVYHKKLDKGIIMPILKEQLAGAEGDDLPIIEDAVKDICRAMGWKLPGKARIHHVQRIWSRPVYVHCRKHFCPDCGYRLQAVKVSRVVNSRSEAARDHDFTPAGGHGGMTGNVKFIWTELFCAKCGTSYSIDRMREIEGLQ